MGFVFLVISYGQYLLWRFYKASFLVSTGSPAHGSNSEAHFQNRHQQAGVHDYMDRVPAVFCDSNTS